MQERRIDERRTLIMNFGVVDVTTGERIGRLVDISPAGLAVVSDADIPLEREFELTLDLPEDAEARESAHFRARSLWRKDDVDPSRKVTGFKVVESFEDHLRAVTALVRDYGFFDGDLRDPSAA